MDRAASDNVDAQTVANQQCRTAWPVRWIVGTGQATGGARANLNARMARRAPTGTTDFNMVGATPLMMAARAADAPLMRLLATLGADPLLVNEDNTTVLMAAAGVGTHSPGEDAGTDSEGFEAVKVAVELGIDVNAVNKDGDTAMHGAAYKQFPSVVRYLAERGANVEIWNTKNNRAGRPCG